MIEGPCISLGIRLIWIPTAGIKAVIQNGSIQYIVENVDLTQVDVFWFYACYDFGKPTRPLGSSRYSETLLFARFLYEILGKPVVDRNLVHANPRAINKFDAYYKLASHGIPVPTSYLFFSLDNLLDSLDDLEFPLISKPLYGNMGMGVALYENAQALHQIFNPRKKFDKQPCLLQKFIPNDGDYRVLTAGEQILVTYYKIRKKENVAANSRLGNKLVPIEIDAEIAEMALKAARLLEIEIAGVDVIEDKNTGQRYILEVNRARGDF